MIEVQLGPSRQTIYQERHRAAGLCTRCPRIACYVRGRQKSLCLKCREHKGAYNRVRYHSRVYDYKTRQRERRERLRERGLCIECGDEPINCERSRARCTGCLDHHNII